MKELAQVINLPGSSGTGTVQISGPVPKATDLGSLFNLQGNLLDILIMIAGAILFVYLMIGGFKYITAQGDPKAVQSARATITYALIGFFIVALVFVIFQVVETFFGISILGSNGHLIPSAYAQGADGVDIGDSVKLGRGGSLKSNFGTLGAFVNRITAFAIPLAGVLFIIYLVYGGLKWVSSQGDKAAVQAARGTITTALIGLTIVAGAFIVLQVIQAITGSNVTGTGG